MNRLLISLMLALAAITARAQFNNDNLSASVYYNNDFGMWVVDVEMNNENTYSTIQADVSVDTTLFVLSKDLYAFSDRITSKTVMNKVSYSHELDAHIWDSKFMRILISSSDNTNILSNSGTVVYLGLEVKEGANVDVSKEYPVNLTNIDLVHYEQKEGETVIEGNYTQGVISDPTICCFDGNCMRPAIYGTISSHELNEFKIGIATSPWAVEADFTNCTMDYIGRVAPDEGSYNYEERYNKNLLFYTNNRNQIGASNKNVVVVSNNNGDKSYGMDCITLYDSGKNFYSSNVITAESASFDRTFYANRWSTICLPFSLDSEQLSELQAVNDFQLEELTGFENGSLKFTTATEMKANRPYLIKTTADSAPFASVNSRTTIAQSNIMDDIEVSNSMVVMKGSLSHKEIVPSNGMAIYGFNSASGDFVKVGTAAELPSFRAYIEIPEGMASAAKLSLNHFDETITAITDIADKETSDSDLYTIDGKLLKKNVSSDHLKTLKSGIYLIGTKKIIIK